MQTEVAAFLSALAKVSRASPNTLAAYRGDLRGFSRFLDDVDVASITADQIRKYLAQIPNRTTRQRGLAGRSTHPWTWSISSRFTSGRTRGHKGLAPTERPRPADGNAANGGADVGGVRDDVTLSVYRCGRYDTWKQPICGCPMCNADRVANVLAVVALVLWLMHVI